MTQNILRYAAFSNDPHSGNPAGVVLDAEGMNEDQMLEWAQLVGFSETAFTTSRADGHHIRYFSPKAEVDFCGHATIATAAALAERDGAGEMLFHTQVGPVAVETASIGGQISATLTSVPTHTREATESEVRETLAALRWSPDDLDERYPPHVAFAGAEHLVLGVATRRRLADLSYDFEQLLSVMSAANWTTVQLFWAEDDRTFHSRNPFPVGGVVEDSATGAAAAALGGYLRPLGRSLPEPLPSTKGRTWACRAICSSTSTLTNLGSR